MVRACCGEDFLIHHLGHCQIALFITLGFLRRSLTQCRLCLSQMTLTSLSLLALTYFTLVYSPVEVELMLSVS